MKAFVEGNPHDTEYLAYLHNETLRMTGNGVAREGSRNENKKCHVRNATSVKSFVRFGKCQIGVRFGPPYRNDRFLLKAPF